MFKPGRYPKRVPLNHETLETLKPSARDAKAHKLLDRIVEIYADRMLTFDLGPSEPSILLANSHDEFCFECQRCGGCCKNPPSLTSPDLSRLSEFLELKKEDFYLKYCQKKILKSGNIVSCLVNLKSRKGGCIFLERGKVAKCSVHTSRPGTCRGLPLKPMLSLYPHANYYLYSKDVRRLLASIGLEVEKSQRPSLDDLLEFHLLPCEGVVRGRKYTVDEWMKENSVHTHIQELTDHFGMVRYHFLMDKTSRSQVGKIINATKKAFELKQM